LHPWLSPPLARPTRVLLRRVPRLQQRMAWAADLKKTWHMMKKRILGVTMGTRNLAIVVGQEITQPIPNPKHQPEMLRPRFLCTGLNRHLAFAQPLVCMCLPC
ncbi:MAG: hypothetical protein ACK53Y_06815, partial [bacterium]